MSRRSRTERNNALRQIIIATALSLIILGAFLFGALPLFLKFTAGESIDLGDGGDKIAPQVPLLSSPVNATNSATISINGFGEAKSDIVIVLNGDKAAQEKIQDDGSFSIPIELTDGENSLSAYTIDEAGNESVESQGYRIVLDTTAPQLDFETPVDGQQFEQRVNQTIPVKGRTENNATVYINGRLVRANSEGLFSSQVQLKEGENRLEFKAIDSAGNVTETSLLVKFRF